MTNAIETPRARTVDMKLEIVVIPVSDVDRAKRFYGSLALQLRFVRTSESMGHHDSGDHGWLAHQLRRRWSFGRRRCGM